MLKDITLGQYFPGHSVIHRLDPRTKLIMLVVYIVALFLAKSWVSYALMLAFLVWVIQISTIPPKAIVRGMKPLVMILLFTGILNLFFSQDGRVLVHFWIITVTTGGVSRAVYQHHVRAGHVPQDGVTHGGIMFFKGFQILSALFRSQQALHRLAFG